MAACPRLLQSSPRRTPLLDLLRRLPEEQVRADRGAEHGHDRYHIG